MKSLKSFENMNPEIPLFQRIRNHGSTAYQDATFYCEAHEKLAIAREQLRFNLRCKNNNLLPRSLQSNPPIRTKEAFDIARQAGRKYLCCFITDDHFRINKNNAKIRDFGSKLRNSLSSDTWTDLKSAALQKMNAKGNITKEHLIQKFNNLLGHQNSRHSSQSSTNFNNVVNLSDKVLSNSHKQVLAKGLNYALQHTEKDKLNFIAANESSLPHSISNNDNLIIQSQVATAIKNTKKVNNLSTEEKNAISDLKHDKDILIVPADKGRSTIVMNKSDYQNKITEHLQDENIYEKLQRNPISSIQSKLNKSLKKLENKKKLTRAEYLRLYSNTNNVPKFYGLVKLHKPGHPIRPIISFCDSPTDQVSKFLTKILNPMTNIAEQKLKNSAHVKNELSNVTLSNDENLISFDVRSLFTQIPPDLALTSLDEALEENDLWKRNTLLDKNEILDLVKICLSSTVFQYNNIIYKQIHGTPMGSSVSVILAEITMQAIEKKIFELSPYPIRFWKRYVDDILAVIPKRNCHDFLNFINSINNHIQFESEMEENRKIAFLDLQINRTSVGDLKFSVYRKPTHTNSYLDFQSNNPLPHKISVVRSLIDRAFNLCSPEYLDEELNFTKTTLRKNGYSLKIINKIVAKNKNCTSRQNIRPQSDVRYIPAPYIKGVTEIVNRNLKNHNLVLASKPSNSLKSELVKLKDKTDNENKSNVIYKINCQDCDQSYIGETNRNLEKRIDEHKRNVRYHTQNSLIFQHVLNNSHQMDWANPKVLDRNSRFKDRKFVEACYSISDTNSFNRFEDISSILAPCIKSICNNIKT